MAGRAIFSPAFRSLLKPAKTGQKILSANYSDHDPPVLVYDFKKGREVVGFGINGEECYADHKAWPYPAIRYKRIEGEIKALKEKEKGDWKLLTKDEVKALYRASFGQTFVEIDHNDDGRWKQIVAQVMFGCSIAMILFLLSEHTVRRTIPDSISLENRQILLKAIIDARIDGITGISSKWDYEKNDWKK